MKMNSPTETNDFWSNIYNLGKVMAPWGTVGYICHQLINRVFKYFSDSRDAELKAIVKVETDLLERKWMEKVESVERKIDNLTKLIIERKS